MRFSYLVLFALFCNYSHGQIIVEGKVLDLNTKNALKGAEVVLLNKVLENSKDSVEFFFAKNLQLEWIIDYKTKHYRKGK